MLEGITKKDCRLKVAEYIVHKKMIVLEVSVKIKLHSKEENNDCNFSVIFLLKIKLLCKRCTLNNSQRYTFDFT